MHLNLQVTASSVAIPGAKAQPWDAGAATTITITSFMHVTNNSSHPLHLDPVGVSDPTAQQQVKCSTCLQTVHLGLSQSLMQSSCSPCTHETVL